MPHKSPWDLTGPSIFSDPKELAAANRKAAMTKRVAERRAAGADMVTLHGISAKADENIRVFKLKEKARKEKKDAEQNLD